MNRSSAKHHLALEPDFQLGGLEVRPSTCRVLRGGVEMRVEALTMSALVVLAHAEGTTVSKEELIRHCWQGRFVSEEAIARTIAKVRLLARGMDPVPFVLETVPKVGFRLILSSQHPARMQNQPPASSMPVRQRAWVSVSLVTGLVVASFLLGAATFNRTAETNDPRVFTTHPETTSIHNSDVQDAILAVSEERMALLLKAGWEVDWTIDTQGATALTWLPLVCERDPAHDQDRLVRLAKSLVAAGADPGYRNKWGDTAYLIAREGRYCGPQHPVTRYLREITPGATSEAENTHLSAHTP